MFKRREKISVFSRVGDFFWPQSGWKRSSHYLFHRLARLPGTPYSIAAGFACGAAVSFTPFVGLHFVLGGVFAYIIRGNILSSAIGTAVGNPGPSLLSGSGYLKSAGGWGAVPATRQPSISSGFLPTLRDPCCAWTSTTSPKRSGPSGGPCSLAGCRRHWPFGSFFIFL